MTECSCRDDSGEMCDECLFEDEMAAAARGELDSRSGD